MQEMESSLVGWKADPVPKSSSSSTSYVTLNVSLQSWASISSNPGPKGLYEAIKDHPQLQKSMVLWYSDSGFSNRRDRQLLTALCSWWFKISHLGFRPMKGKIQTAFSKEQKRLEDSQGKETRKGSHF